MKKLILFVVFVVFVAACYLLFSGADFLLFILPGQIPFGNVIGALCFILPSVGVQYYMNDVTRLKSVRTISIMMSCLWLPISMALSGNMQLRFQGDSFAVWLLFSGAVSLLILFTLLHSVVFCIKTMKSRRSN